MVQYNTAIRSLYHHMVCDMSRYLVKLTGLETSWGCGDTVNK